MTGAPSWPPHFFDLTDPDGPGVKPSLIVPLLIDDLAHEVSHTPDWRIDQPGGALITLKTISQTDDESSIRFTTPNAEGVIRLVCDPAGWLRMEVTIGEAEVFRAWLDQPYEEYDLWPPNAVKSSDAPGRMGKRRNWLSIDTRAWPALKPLVPDGDWLNLHAMDYITIYVRLPRNGPDVWRPVQAVPADNGFELLAPKTSDPEIELWEFPPGSIVRCDMRKLADEDVVVAVELLKTGRD